MKRYLLLMPLFIISLLFGNGVFAHSDNWDLDFTTVWEDATTMRLSGVVVDLK